MLDLIDLKNKIDGKNSFIFGYLEKVPYCALDRSTIDDIKSDALIQCVDQDSDDYESALSLSIQNYARYKNRIRFFGDLCKSDSDSSSESDFMDRLSIKNNPIYCFNRKRKQHSGYPKDFLDQLTVQQRKFIELENNGLSRSEIASQTGKTYNNTVSNLFRIRTLFNQYLDSKGTNCRKKRGWQKGLKRGPQSSGHIHKIISAKRQDIIESYPEEFIETLSISRQKLLRDTMGLTFDNACEKTGKSVSALRNILYSLRKQYRWGPEIWKLKPSIKNQYRKYPYEKYSEFFMSLLTSSQREIIYLRRDGLNCKHIADRYHISINSVYSRLQRIKLRYAKYVHQKANEPGTGPDRGNNDVSISGR